MSTTLNEVSVTRKTKETDIAINLSWQMDAYGTFLGSSGVGFFDHMLNTFCHYSGLVLTLKMSADYHVDQHHALEDLGYVLGIGLRKLADSQVTFRRFSSQRIPMDDALCEVSLDLGGRFYYTSILPTFKPLIGSFESDTLDEFLRAFCQTAGLCCHIEILRGKNDHHMVEALFKTLGFAIYEALTPALRQGFSSTKGSVQIKEGE